MITFSEAKFTVAEMPERLKSTHVTSVEVVVMADVTSIS